MSIRAASVNWEWEGGKGVEEVWGDIRMVQQLFTELCQPAQMTSRTRKVGNEKQRSGESVRGHGSFMKIASEFISAGLMWRVM